MNTAYLLMGGNMGNTRQIFCKVTEDLRKQNIFVKRHSSLYKTAAWGMENQPDFLNIVTEAETELSARELLAAILQTETKNGRIRQEKYGPRVIDIDILFFNNDIIQEPDLIIPHPLLQERNFALRPLAELIPDFIHPVFNKSMQQLSATSKDELKAEKLDE